MQDEQLGDTEESPVFLPYSPRLRELLKSYGASLLLIYLEQHFPASQDTPNQPFVLDIDRTRHTLRLGGQAFWEHLKMIAVGWRSAKRRNLARLAGREFLTKLTRGAGAYKPYSYLRVNNARTIEIRRNPARISQLLTLAGIDHKQSGRTWDADLVNDHGFPPSSEHFAIETGAQLAREMAKSLSPLDDGRRKPGLKRRFAKRSPWTEERRNKFRETMIRRGYWHVDKRAISDVDME